MRWRLAVSSAAHSILKSCGASMACGPGTHPPSETVRESTRHWAKGALAAALASVLTGCGGGASQATQPPASVERINGIVVPPSPDATTNQATVGGVDVNGNGIRDDIDRLVATNFGTEPQLVALATEHARRLQVAIVAPSTAATGAYVNQVRCVRDDAVLNRLSSQTRAMLDTAQRRKAYALAMAGTTVSAEGC